MTRRRLFVALAIALGGAFAACSTFDSAPNDPDAGSGDGGDGGTVPDGPLPPIFPDVVLPDVVLSDGRALECPTGGEGPSMVIAPNPGGACIDRTEVTRRQYGAFHNRMNPTEHARLTTLVPEICKDVVYQALNIPLPSALDHPYNSVSFCSAAYYCAAQNKRLCGEPGTGAFLEIKEGENRVLEWDLACSMGRDPAKYYPWGIDRTLAARLGCQVSAQNTRDAGAEAGCGPSSGAPLDMIGNVWEWVAMRVTNDAGTALLAVRGGGYQGATVGNGCMTPHAIAVAETTAPDGQFGFRCCATPR